MKYRKLKILVVDDSPVVRKVLSNELLKDRNIKEVQTAPSGSLALRKIDKYDPDVVTLDVEMPRLDGLSTLKMIMEQSPRPVIMVSAYTHEGADKTLRALELGAVDFIAKPVGQLSREVSQITTELKEKIVAVAQLREKWLNKKAAATIVSSAPPIAKLTSKIQPRLSRKQGEFTVVGIGASTGGTEAIRKVLSRIPADIPCGFVMVQHMPAGFTKSFAERLDYLSDVEVKEAQDRDLIVPGRVLLAPGHSHIVVRKSDIANYVELLKTPEVNGHRPAVDVLFESMADEFGQQAIGVILTGMGRDGASGMRQLHRSGALTLAQSEKSCVVFGMPKVAIEEGSVDIVASHFQLGEILCNVPNELKNSGKTKTINKGTLYQT